MREGRKELAGLMAELDGSLGIINILCGGYV